jgi:hypothetical protein
VPSKLQIIGGDDGDDGDRTPYGLAEDKLRRAIAAANRIVQTPRTETTYTDQLLADALLSVVAHIRFREPTLPPHLRNRWMVLADHFSFYELRRIAFDLRGGEGIRAKLPEVPLSAPTPSMESLILVCVDYWYKHDLFSTFFAAWEAERPSRVLEIRRFETEFLREYEPQKHNEGGNPL